MLRPRSGALTFTALTPALVGLSSLVSLTSPMSDAIEPLGDNLRPRAALGAGRKRDGRRGPEGLSVPQPVDGVMVLGPVILTVRLDACG